jgi:hypothetical protein
MPKPAASDFLLERKIHHEKNKRLNPVLPDLAYSLS